jgi:hypothetical protein
MSDYTYRVVTTAFGVMLGMLAYDVIKAVVP